MFNHEDMHAMRDNVTREVAKQGEYGMIAFLVLGFLVGKFL